MAYATKAERDKYDLLKNKHKGLSQLLDILTTPGLRDASGNGGHCDHYSEDTLIKNIDLIVDTISALPLIDGAFDEEISSIMKEKMSALDRARERYEKRLEEANEQLKQELADIPKREESINKERRALQQETLNFASKKYLFEKEKKAFADEKRHLEENRKKILEFETAEGRDRARLAVLYLEQTPKDEWTNKAIAWSLGAIYSGGQIPNFGKKET